MASSAVEVINEGLALLGARPIASLTEGTKTASLAATVFADERDATLRAHPWKFARQRQQLAQTAAPLSLEDWSYSYQLPTSPYCLKVLKLNGGRIPWTIEGRKLLTNDSVAKALYTARIESPSEWDPMYTSALAARLAMTMAYPLTEQANLQKQMSELYAFKLSEARSIDSQEGFTEELSDETLIDVRSGGYGFSRRSGWTME